MTILFTLMILTSSVSADILSSWQTCATTSDRLSRHPDLQFKIPNLNNPSSPSSCIYNQMCAPSCSSLGGACATICGPPFTGGACSCGDVKKCGSNCQGCTECANCCCQSPKYILEVDSTSTFQTIEGFGGAFTEAAALNFASLKEENQQVVLDAYFGAPFGDESAGHGYQLGRIPINSCDFSPSQFSYDNVTGDGPNLPHFDHTVAHDAKLVIPFVLKAQERAARAATTQTNDSLRLFGSPWSPPAWMKNPGGNRPNTSSMSGSNPQQGLATDQQDAWANYLSDWVSGFKKHGVNIWGITVQNEAEFAAPWEACVYNATFQAQFIGKYLGPTMAKNHFGLKIMAYDHNKDHVALWAQVLAADNGPNGALQYLAGVAFHWYVNGPGCSIGTGDCMAEGASNLLAAYNALNNATATDPTLTTSSSPPFLLATESCNCPGVADDTRSKGWQRGERLMRDALSDLNHYSVGYVDWNLLVDYTGGPNHLGNNCDANIVADPQRKLTNKTSGAGYSEVVLRPSYYMLGHIARFARRGSVRLGVSFKVEGGGNKGGEGVLLGADFVDVAAFTMPNGSTSVILLNRGEQTVEYTLRDKATGREAELTALAHSAQSFIF